MSENDLEEQINELLVIQEICGAENVQIFTRNPANYEGLLLTENAHFFKDFKDDHEIGGLIQVSPCLTEKLKVIWKDENSQNHDFYVKYLQPLRIKFVNPKSYPSQSCTHFTLDCSWLTQNQLEKIREKFLEIWEENGNNVILFSWISEIKDGLQITDSELNLDPLIPKKKIVEEYEGILVKFLVQRGFGFIFCPATNCQYFVHRTNMNFTPNGMALVSFFVKPKKTQLEAIKVIKKGTELQGCEMIKGKISYKGALDVSRWSFHHKYGFVWIPDLDRYIFAREAQLNFKLNKDVDCTYKVEFGIKELRKDYFEAVQVKLTSSAVKKPRISELLEPPDLVKSLKDFNEVEESRVFGTQLFNCNVCFAEKSGKSCLKFADCGHIFCNDCMRTYFEVQIRQGQMSSLTCPEEQCKSQALPNQVKSLVSEKNYKLYEEVLLSTTLETMADVILCPRRHCQCPTLIDREASMGQCPNPECAFVFCIYCKATFHGVAPCRMKSKEQRALITEYMGANGSEKELMEKRYGKRQLETMVNNLLSETYLSENTKPCPKCQAPIQKSEGCNKMTCNKCGTYFCYICGAKLPSENPYSHFSSPVGDCYQLLFEGVDNAEDDFLMVENEDEDEDFFMF